MTPWPLLQTSSHNRLRIVGLVLICFSVFAAYMLENYHATLMRERQEKTQKWVENAHHLIAYYHTKQENQELNQESAQHYALDAIKQLSQGQEGYFWVMDTHPRMIMHPKQPNLDGTDLTDYISPNGKKLFLDMVRIIETSRAGFIEYAWTKPDTNDGRFYPKISYIKTFEPWNWIIGSGAYVDDVNTSFWNAVFVTLGISIAIVIFIIVLSMVVSEGFKKSKG